MKRIEWYSKGLTYFMRVTLLLAMAFAVHEFYWTIFFLSLLTFGFTFLPFLFDYYALRLPKNLSLAIIFCIYATLYLGEVGAFYEKFWWWDLLLHGGSALGFGIIGFLILFILQMRKHIAGEPITIAVFSFTFAVAIGALWEVFEFSLDQILGTNLQKSGLWDTMGDLIVDCAGAALASLFGFVYLKGWLGATFLEKWIGVPERKNHKSSL